MEGRTKIWKTCPIIYRSGFDEISIKFYFSFPRIKFNIRIPSWDIRAKTSTAIIILWWIMVRKAGKSISLLLFIVYIYLPIANRWFYLISFNFICISVLHESGLCPEWCSKNKIKLANANWSDCRIQISKLGSFGDCLVWQFWYWCTSFLHDIWRRPLWGKAPTSSLRLAKQAL